MSNSKPSERQSGLVPARAATLFQHLASGRVVYTTV